MQKWISVSFFVSSQKPCDALRGGDKMTGESKPTINAVVVIANGLC
jgi:hypothetical protein